jgi:hypothetical protein
VARGSIVRITILSALFALYPQILFAEINGLWDISWNSPAGSWKGLLEFSGSDEGASPSVTFDGLPSEYELDDDTIDLHLELPKDGVGGELSGQTVKKVHLVGQLTDDHMSGVGDFTHVDSEDIESFSWKGEQILTSQELGPADFTGVWKPMTVALSSWRPVPLPMTDVGREAMESFVWYQDDAHRCVSPGITRIFGWPYPLELVQIENQLAAVYEVDSVVRRIFISDVYPDTWPPDNLGYSNAKWAQNGRELNIVTRHISPHFMGNTGMRLLDEDARIVERMVLSNDGNYLFWIMTVDAPGSFTDPLVRKALWKRAGEDENEILPYECDPYAFFRDLHIQDLTGKYFETVFPD